MKTLIKLLIVVMSVCLIAGCEKQDDPYQDNTSDLQLKSADTRTINFDLMGDYYTPVICNGETVDEISVDMASDGFKAHATVHMVDGIWKWAIAHIKATIVSQSTGETYILKDQIKVTFDENGDMATNTSHTHVKGDKGTHVIMFFEFDVENQTLMLLKGVCPGDADE
jgi:acetaldehyde dehydrogenase (acetylating)